MADLIRTLIVDDSAFVRKVVREMLSRSPFIDVVGMARNGEEALEMVENLNPDVVTCDLVMPQFDGIGFVKAQMARKPVPIIVLSASPGDGPRVLEAIEAGAIDFVRKPTALATDELLNIREELIEKVKTAARAPIGNLRTGILTPEPAVLEPHPLEVDAVVLGTSTGGPQALRYLLPQFPADFPVPIVMVLHMPLGYTALFAEKLNELSKLNVTEAREGDLLQAGKALLAPAGRHLLLKRNAKGNVFAHLAMEPINKPHRPSVDVLFQSTAETFGNRSLAVVMTGMGDDGKQGAAWIKARGGRVITESEESCIIYGMPRSVAEAGLSDASFPLQSLAEGIMKYL